MATTPGRVLSDAILGRLDPVVQRDPVVLRRYAAATQYMAAICDVSPLSIKWTKRAMYLNRLADRLENQK